MSDEKNPEVQTPQEPDFSIRVGTKNVFKEVKDFVVLIRSKDDETIRLYSNSLWADGACRQFRSDLGVAHEEDERKRRNEE